MQKKHFHYLFAWQNFFPLVLLLDPGAMKYLISVISTYIVQPFLLLISFLISPLYFRQWGLQIRKAKPTPTLIIIYAVIGTSCATMHCMLENKYSEDSTAFCNKNKHCIVGWLFCCRTLHIRWPTV